MAQTYWVPMVSNAVRIIELFLNTGHELSLKEMSASTGVAKTSTFRILSTLEKLGYVHKVPETGKFYLGSKIVQAVRHAVPSTDLVRVARPQLENLQDRFNETVNLATLRRGEVLYLDIVESRQSFRMAATVGSVAPLHATAIGKCFLAFWPDGNVEDAIKSIKFTRLTPHTITNRTSLARSILDIRRRGYATDKEETELGASCVGVPILDGNLRAIAALSISGPTPRLRKASNQIIHALKQAAGSIAERLGIA